MATSAAGGAPVPEEARLELPSVPRLMERWMERTGRKGPLLTIDEVICWMETTGGDDGLRSINKADPPSILMVASGIIALHLNCRHASLEKETCPRPSFRAHEANLQRSGRLWVSEYSLQATTKFRAHSGQEPKCRWCMRRASCYGRTRPQVPRSLSPCRVVRSLIPCV